MYVLWVCVVAPVRLVNEFKAFPLLLRGRAPSRVIAQPTREREGREGEGREGGRKNGMEERVWREKGGYGGRGNGVEERVWREREGVEERERGGGGMKLSTANPMLVLLSTYHAFSSFSPGERSAEAGSTPTTLIQMQHISQRSTVY